MSVRAARLARAASKQSMQPPAAEQPSDASLDDMLNRVESLVQRAQSDLPHDIETACSLEASRGRVEREALCAELHSVEDECALPATLAAGQHTERPAHSWAAWCVPLQRVREG